MVHKRVMKEIHATLLPLTIHKVISGQVLSEQGICPKHLLMPMIFGRGPYLCCSALLHIHMVNFLGPCRSMTKGGMYNEVVS